MSRATSKRAQRARDWQALLQAVRSEQDRITPEAKALWLAGKWSDPRPIENEAYIDAIQAALEGRDSARLLSMLDGGMPISEALLPALAEVIRDAKQGRSDGRPSELTALDDETIRLVFDKARRKGQAKQYLADTLKVSVDTIWRSLKRTKPIK